MGSRLRTNPTRFVECWCEVVAPKGQDNPPWIVQKLPRTYGEEEVLKSVPQFTFPCAFEKSAVQHFSFVLTNLESKFLYGFCRHAPDSESAIVFLSHLPWHELFYKLLNHCSSLIANENSGDLWSFLQSLYQLSVPAPGTKLSISYGDNKFFVAECPNHLILPSIPENRNLSEYFSAVDVENMMTIFASMLNERRIIFTSERVSRLSACVQAANTLIYPMSWQHIFIPVLPEHLVDYLSAPMPFLIGIAWSLMQKVNIDEIGEVVILNADTNKVTSPFNDLQNLPEEVVSSLRKNLNPSNNLLGDSVARAFLKALVSLIGNYREALQFREEDRKITFCEEKFITQRPSHFQPFVQKMLELQIFRQFIEERVDLLNSGLHTSDEFELEAIVFGERSSSKMKQIISNVKKESGAIMKNVKNKTNPAVKSAVKSVKSSGKNVREKSKITYKGIKGKLRDIQQGTGVPKSIESSRFVNGEAITKPRSAPSSPTQPFSQRRMNKKSVSGIYEGYSAKASYAKRSTHTFVQKTVTLEDRSLQNQHSDEYQKTPSPQEIDLIGEMEDALKTQLIFMGPDLSPNKHSSLSSLSSFTQQDTVSNFSVSSSVISNNDANFNNAYMQNDSQNPLDGQCFENSKHLSASLTSLPLLDLSLDIPMPPPLFPQLSSSLPQTCCEPTSLPLLFDLHNEDLSGNGQDNYSLACQKTMHFRSPKISTHFSEPYSIASNACQFNSPSSNHYIFGERRLENSRVSSIIASCYASSSVGGGPMTQNQNLQIGGSSVTRPRRKSRTLPSGSLLPVVASNTAIVSTPVRPMRRNLTSTASTPNVSVSSCKSVRCVFPKYDVSPSFSASLARFSLKDSNASYFFSFLSRPTSKSTDSLFDVEFPNTIINLSPTPDLQVSLSPPDILPPSKVTHFSCGKLSPPYKSDATEPDIMSMSLPTGISSLSQIRSFQNGGDYSSPISPPPRSHRRRKKASNLECGSIQKAENGSSQDLLFMESPREESFDPFFGQEISPPIPSRLSKNSNSIENARETGSLNINETALDMLAGSDLQLPSNPPRKLSPTRYLPFNTLQTCSPNISNVSLVQNPMYNPHQLPYIRPLQHPPPPPSRSTNPFIIDDNKQVGSLKSNNPLTVEFESNESYNPAVAFAASMLSNSSNPSITLKSSHNFSQNPFISGAMNSRDQNKKFTNKDLLGDFSSDFQKLSVNAKDKNCNL